VSSAQTYALTDAQTVTIVTAVTLLGRYGQVLSEHEAAMVEAVGERFKRTGRLTYVTPNEWPVLEEAVGAMVGVKGDAERRA
jgi:hypothetical protein